MEVDEAQTQASKFSRVANGRIDSSKTVGVLGDTGGRLRGWQHSSRIIRVSRASGGKDRHSKVWTAKGPRDRRVRLSVATAIQFYDLQDRLGVDQPSKAVEWLIKAAADAIAELPSLEGVFPETPRQISDENRPELGGGNAQQGFDSSAEVEIDGDAGFAQTNLSRSSACSSNSETSKGSGGLSLSRNEIRVKARERARERTAKDKEPVQQQQLNQNQNQSSSSFTQLLTAGIRNMENAGVSSESPMDYFNASGLMGGSSARGQIIQLGNSGIHQAMMAAAGSSPFSNVGGGDQNHHHNHHQHHTELQHFPFIPDQDHYNLNFSISQSSNSSGLASGFNNRGTLQSNSSQSLLPHHQLQRFSTSPLDGATVPFFLGAPVENQHHHQHGGASLFPPELQLYYGNNGGRQSDQKGKGKN